MSSVKVEFLYQSLSDTQAIIRATDVKLGFLFAIVLLPITVFNDIYNVALDIVHYSIFFSMVVGVVAILWFLSLYTLFLGLVAISNPASCVSGEKSDGSFHSGDLFSFGFVDRFFNQSVLSKYSVDELVQRTPEDEAQVIEELAFEKIKTIYIRDLKIKRTSQCIILIFAWISLGISVWSIYLYKVASGC